MIDPKTSLAVATAAIQEAGAEFDSELASAHAESDALRQQVADLQAKLDPWSHVDKTGNTDVTAAFQTLVAKGGKPPEGTYLIDAEIGIGLDAGSTLDLTGCALMVKPNGATGYALLRIDNPDCTIIGGTLIGDRDLHDYGDGSSTHEWGYGIRVSGDRATIRYTVSRDMTGDGFYVGRGATGTRIDGVTANNNRRQGISITHAYDVKVTDSMFLNTNGTSPQAGVDIEPNKGEDASGITFSRCTMRGNLYGVNVQARNRDVTFADCTITGNRSIGLKNVAGETLAITGGTVGHNGKTGVSLAGGSTAMTDVALDLNYQAQSPVPRATPLIADGPVPPKTDRDLLVAAGATLVANGLKFT